MGMNKHPVFLKNRAITFIDRDIDMALEILIRLVCFNQSEINNCLELAIRKGYNWYIGEVMYNGASTKICDMLLKKLEEDDDHGYSVPTSLAWIGDSKVIDLFNNWNSNSPKWNKYIRSLSADYYTLKAGWILNEDGKRINLYYEDCYPIELNTPADDEPLYFNIIQDDKCPWCNNNLIVLFDFDLTIKF
jgi:hypothetical protein